MKRLFWLVIMLVILLSACSDDSGVSIEPDENTMIVNIKNNVDFDMYGLEVNILNHSSTMMNADGSKIKKGESLRFALTEQDFALDGKEKMEVVILKNSNNRFPINKEVTIELTNNKQIFFEITGESIRELDLKRAQ